MFSSVCDKPPSLECGYANVAWLWPAWSGWPGAVPWLSALADGRRAGRGDPAQVGARRQPVAGVVAVGAGTVVSASHESYMERPPVRRSSASGWLRPDAQDADRRDGGARAIRTRGHRLMICLRVLSPCVRLGYASGPTPSLLNSWLCAPLGAPACM